MIPTRDIELGAALERALPPAVPARGAKARILATLKSNDRRSRGTGPRTAFFVLALSCLIAVLGFYAGVRQHLDPAPRAEDAAMSLGFARILLRPGAEVKVERDDEQGAIVELVSGVALFHVKKNSGRTFEVVAGGARVEVVGTVFAVSFVPPSDVRVEVVEGVVRIRSAGGEQLIAGNGIPAGTTLFDDARELSTLRAPVTEFARIPASAPAAHLSPRSSAVANDAGAAAVPVPPRSRVESPNPYALAKRMELSGDRDGALTAYRRISGEPGTLAEDAQFAVIRLLAERRDHAATLTAVSNYRHRFAAGRYGRDVDVRALNAHLSVGDIAAARRAADAFLTSYPDDPRAWRFRLARASQLSQDGDCAGALADLRHVPDGAEKARIQKSCAAP